MFTFGKNFGTPRESSALEQLVTEYISTHQVVEVIEEVIVDGIENECYVDDIDVVTNIAESQFFTIDKTNVMRAVRLPEVYERGFKNMKRGAYVFRRVLSIAEYVDRDRDLIPRSSQEVSSLQATRYKTAIDVYPAMKEKEGIARVSEDENKRRELKPLFGKQLMYGLFVDSEYKQRPVRHGLVDPLFDRTVKEDFRRIVSIEDVCNAVEIYELVEYVKIDDVQKPSYSHYLNKFITNRTGVLWRELVEEAKTSKIESDHQFRLTIIDDEAGVTWYVPFAGQIVGVKSVRGDKTNNLTEDGFYIEELNGEDMVVTEHVPLSSLNERGISRDRGVTKAFINTGVMPNRKFEHEENKFRHEEVKMVVDAKTTKVKASSDKKKAKSEKKKAKITEDSTRVKATAETISSGAKIFTGVVGLVGLVAGYLAHSSATAAVVATGGPIGVTAAIVAGATSIVSSIARAATGFLSSIF